MSEFERQPFYRPMTRIEKFREGLTKLGITEQMADKLICQMIREHELSKVYGKTLAALNTPKWIKRVTRLLRPDPKLMKNAVVIR